MDALREFHGDVKLVAEALDCSTSYVHRRMREFNLFTRNYKEAYVRLDRNNRPR